MRHFNWLLITFLAFSFIACKDDDDPVLDTTDPQITLISPEDGASFEIGETMTLEGTITDNVAVTEVTVSIDGPVTFQDMVLNPNQASFTFNTPIEVTNEYTPGQYTVTVTAEDAAGNSASETRTITITGDDGTEPETAITFIINADDLPENTPDDEGIYISGQFAESESDEGHWDEPGSNEAMRLTPQEDGTYTITLEPNEDAMTAGVLEYKFFREGGWETGEQTADCEAAPNRVFDLSSEDRTVTGIEIAAWEGLCP